MMLKIVIQSVFGEDFETIQTPVRRKDVIERDDAYENWPGVINAGWKRLSGRTHPGAPPMDSVEIGLALSYLVKFKQEIAPYFTQTLLAACIKIRMSPKYPYHN
jgi:hypothetical protein